MAPTGARPRPEEVRDGRDQGSSSGPSRSLLPGALAKTLAAADQSPDPVQAGIERRSRWPNPTGAAVAALWRLQADWKISPPPDRGTGGRGTERATMRIGAAIHLARAELSSPTPQCAAGYRNCSSGSGSQAELESRRTRQTTGEGPGLLPRKLNGIATATAIACAVSSPIAAAGDAPRSTIRLRPREARLTAKKRAAWKPAGRRRGRRSSGGSRGSCWHGDAEGADRGDDVVDAEVPAERGEDREVDQVAGAADHAELEQLQPAGRAARGGTEPVGEFAGAHSAGPPSRGGARPLPGAWFRRPAVDDDGVDAEAGRQIAQRVEWNSHGVVDT